MKNIKSSIVKFIFERVQPACLPPLLKCYSALDVKTISIVIARARFLNLPARRVR